MWGATGLGFLDWGGVTRLGGYWAASGALQALSSAMTPPTSVPTAVSNEVPEHPCVSPVSNHVYERRLIEKYIAENGTDPVNNQPLSEEQLIDIKGRGAGGGSPCLFSRGRAGLEETWLGGAVSPPGSAGTPRKGFLRDWCPR